MNHKNSNLLVRKTPIRVQTLMRASPHTSTQKATRSFQPCKAQHAGGLSPAPGAKCWPCTDNSFQFLCQIQQSKRNVVKCREEVFEVLFHRTMIGLSFRRVIAYLLQTCSARCLQVEWWTTQNIFLVRLVYSLLFMGWVTAKPTSEIGGLGGPRRVSVRWSEKHVFDAGPRTQTLIVAISLLIRPEGAPFKAGPM